MPKRSIFLPNFKQTGLSDLTLTSIYEKPVHAYPTRITRPSKSRLYGPADPVPRGRGERPE